MASLKNVAAALTLYSAAGLKVTVPGTGMEPSKITPFKESHVDGFSKIGCVKDDLHLHGDKHGDGKFSYKLGDVSGVSIIHYTEMIPKMDQKPMTPDTCFGFCRTVPDMLFFGITNGRDCYCGPYYKQIAGDSSDCDAPCDGDSSQMCGGKSKSDVYEMHACNDAAANLKAAVKKGLKAVDELVTLAEDLKSSADYMQSNAEQIQAAFGKVGDSAVSGLCQSAKQFAGKCTHAADDGKKHGTEIEAFGAQAGDVGNDQESEKLTGELNDASGKAGSQTKELAALKKTISPPSDEQSSKLYYPIMYFADKAFKDSPTTCGGKAAADPSVTTFKGCATSCEDAVVAGCVGFNYVAGSDGKGLCFIFSQMTSATYYSGCSASKQKPAFLQKAEDGTNCMVKFSAFDGVALNPDPSGKSKMALKELKEANRCFK